MDILAWLEGLPRYSNLKFNLYRTWLLLGRIIPNYNEMEIFFVTGSKGKGTVAATLAAILGAAGVPTGLLTSPHLISVCERIKMDGCEIEPWDLEENLAEVYSKLPELPERYGTWIFSEVLLAAALLWFIKRRAAAIVLEAGLGGRLDPGNIFRKPIATCITSVAMEHRGILGNNLAEIAAEKAGIIKGQTPIITAATGEALTLIQKRAAVFSAPVLTFGTDFSCIAIDGQVELKMPDTEFSFEYEFETDAAGTNKVMAACLASLYPGVTAAAIIQGIKSPDLPGRFEIFPGPPVFILDVAHTPESVANFVKGVCAKYPGRRLAFVAGFLADKPATEMLRILASTAAKVYYAPVQDCRSFVPGQLELAWGIPAASIAAAMLLAKAQAEVICVTGSFSAVREARLLLSKGV